MAEQNQKNNRRALITSLVNRLGVGGYELEKQLLAMDQDQLDEYVRVLTRPDLDVRYSETASQLSIRTWYGTVNMDGNAGDRTPGKTSFQTAADTRSTGRCPGDGI